MPSVLRIAASFPFHLRAMTALCALALVGCVESSDETSPQYTIGGSISGLATDGLVLANGSETLSVSSTATQFSFAARQAMGSGYAVTVQSEPSGMTCGVANGIGVVEVHDVSSVAVTCEQTYSLGGTASGVIRSGLVLANDGETLSIDSNARTLRLRHRYCPAMRMPCRYRVLRLDSSAASQTARARLRPRTPTTSW